MHIKPDIMTVLQGRMVAILYLMEQFTEMYKGQESHAKLLDAVRGGIRKLEPVFRMLPQKIKANIEGCAAEVIGEHAVEVCQLCANAGWFVAEIESVISDTSCELNPELVDDPPFLIPESFPAEQHPRVVPGRAAEDPPGELRRGGHRVLRKDQRGLHHQRRNGEPVRTLTPRPWRPFSSLKILRNINLLFLPGYAYCRLRATQTERTQP